MAIVNLYFSDVFEVTKKTLEDYDAFNISLITDLPLFIDPFHLFHSDKKEYRELHNRMIDYLAFLRDKSATQTITKGLLRSWYFFPEIEQNWFGFTTTGNKGHDLGPVFARALNTNLVRLLPSFGKERITKGTHLEKLCLIKEKVGKDNISDFTTNLTLEYLLKYTQSFAEKYIKPAYTKRWSVAKVRFNYSTEKWESDFFNLPTYDNDFVLLTPKDMLTKDDTWINRHDFLDDFREIVDAVPNIQLREELDNYLQSALKERLKKEVVDKAITNFAVKYPELIDHYIKIKEDDGDTAISRSIEKVSNSNNLYVEHFGNLVQLLAEETPFYKIKGITAEESYRRIQYLKDVIENKGGWRIFYDKNGQPIRNENDLHIMYRLTWCATVLDVSHEVNNGRGPADYKISLGAFDKTMIEFKLASNHNLKQQLKNQLEIYKKASDAQFGYKVIVYFTDQELQNVQRILRELDISNDRNIILIDARKKLSASKVV